MNAYNSFSLLDLKKQGENPLYKGDLFVAICPQFVNIMFFLLTLNSVKSKLLNLN